MDIRQYNAIVAELESGPYEYAVFVVDGMRNLGLNGREQQMFKLRKGEFSLDVDSLLISWAFKRQERISDYTSERQAVIVRNFLPLQSVLRVRLESEPVAVRAIDPEDWESKKKAAFARHVGNRKH